MNTRRYPRTLQEAFGPYASGPIHPMPDPNEHKYARACLIVLAVITVASIGLAWITR